MPLPEHPFECDLVRALASGKTPYLRFDLNDYSIPPRTSDSRSRSSRPRRACASSTAPSRSRGTRAATIAAEEIEDRAHLEDLADDKRRAHELRGRDRLDSVVPACRRAPRGSRAARRPSRRHDVASVAPPRSRGRPGPRRGHRRGARARSRVRPRPSRTSSTSERAREERSPARRGRAPRRPARPRPPRHAALARVVRRRLTRRTPRRRSPMSELDDRLASARPSCNRRAALRPRRARDQGSLGRGSDPRARRRPRGTGARPTQPRAPLRREAASDASSRWPTSTGPGRRISTATRSRPPSASTSSRRRATSCSSRRRGSARR